MEHFFDVVIDECENSIKKIKKPIIQWLSPPHYFDYQQYFFITIVKCTENAHEMNFMQRDWVHIVVKNVLYQFFSLAQLNRAEKSICSMMENGRKSDLQYE